MKRPLTTALAACLLAACGQTGALYLPDEGVTTPVEIRPAPPAEPATPAPPPGKEDKREDAPAPPPGAWD
jgi:predicted small lipoprotein YifL